MPRCLSTLVKYLLIMMAKKQSVTRVNATYSKTKDSLGKYYKRELTTQLSTRVVVWEEGGYDLMVDRHRKQDK